MGSTITVLYPPGDFDMDYYLKKHMPLVQEHWHARGLKGYRVTKITAEASGGEPPYSVQCILDFDSAEAFQKAIEADGPTILGTSTDSCRRKLWRIPSTSDANNCSGDIPNFTKTQPTIIIGDVQGSA